MSEQTNKRVLLVEDEDMNRKIIKNDLNKHEYEVVSAENGQIAMDILKDDRDFSVIILDRMMPVMNGMEVLKRLNDDKELKNIPVVMQTAAAASQQIKEGIEAGVFYYLTKPFSKDLLISILDSAIRDFEYRNKLVREVSTVNRLMGLMDVSRFRFNTLEECHNLSYLLANACPDPKKVVFGLAEMMVNAVEHGNLGITYEEKKNLIIERVWQREIEKRLSMPEYSDRYANIHFERSHKEIKLTIEDSGEGFNWQEYMDLSVHRINDPNGRGITMARSMSFDKVEYNNEGNVVHCSVLL